MSIASTLPATDRDPALQRAHDVFERWNITVGPTAGDDLLQTPRPGATELAAALGTVLRFLEPAT